MYLVLGTLGIFIISSIALVVCNKLNGRYDLEGAEGFFGAVVVFSAFVLIFMNIIIALNHINYEATVERTNAQSEAYEDEYNYLINADSEYLTYMDINKFFEEVRDHNASIAYKQASQKNKWVSWFRSPKVQDLEKADINADQ